MSVADISMPDSSTRTPEVTEMEADGAAPAIILSPRPPSLTPDADVIVVGGGPAGLSAALVLARSTRSVIILDAGTKRNDAAYYQHAVLGADGDDRRAFLDRALHQVLQYPTVTYYPNTAAVDVRIYAAPGVNGSTAFGPPQRSWLFEVRAQEEESSKTSTTEDKKSQKIFRSRKLVLATGVGDVVPDIPGMARYFGRGVGVCLYCNAYERQGQYMAAYGRGARGVHLALEMTLWSPGRVVLLTGGAALQATPAERKSMADRGVEVVESPILRVYGDDDSDDEEESMNGGKKEEAHSDRIGLNEEQERGNMRGVELAGGRRIPVTALFFNTGRHQRSTLPTALGLETNDRGDLKCCERGGVGSLPGLFAAGNCAAAPLKLVITAASQGAITGARINSELLYEDLGMTEQGGWLDEEEREDHHAEDVAAVERAGERKDLADLLAGIAAAFRAEE